MGQRCRASMKLSKKILASAGQKPMKIKEEKTDGEGFEPPTNWFEASYSIQLS